MDSALAVSATWQRSMQSSQRHKDKFGPAASARFRIFLYEETYNMRDKFYVTSREHHALHGAKGEQLFETSTR